MVEIDFRNLIILISLSIHSSLLWVLFKYGRNTKGGRAYIFAILAIIGWIIPMFLYRIDFLNNAIIWTRFLYIMASFTSVTFFYFTLIFPNKEIQKWVKYLILIELSFIILLISNSNLIVSSVEKIKNAENVIHFGSFYFIFALHIITYFFLGFFVLLKNWFYSKGLLKKQLMNIFIGYFFASSLAMFTNLILPWFGYFELNWVGQFFSIIVVISTLYAIFRNNLLGIEIISTEAFIIILNLFLFFQVLFFVNSPLFLLNIFVFFSVLFFSHFLLSSVKKELKRRKEVTKLAESLKKKNLELENLSQQKTEFLSIASHQLKTPLTVISGYSEQLLENKYGKLPKKMREVIEEIDESSDRLVQLANSFLNINKIEEGQIQYHFAVHDLNGVVESVIEELQELADQKKIEMAFDSSDFAKNCFVDEEHIRHVVFNYIDNAIKYSDAGKIQITLRQEKKGIAFRVKDQGYGFGYEDEAAFFNKFYRGQNIIGKNVNGTGLGLYVCKRFVEAHHGWVWAKSNGIDQGSEFGFWIPNEKNRETE